MDKAVRCADVSTRLGRAPWKAAEAVTLAVALMLFGCASLDGLTGGAPDGGSGDAKHMADAGGSESDGSGGSGSDTGTGGSGITFVQAIAVPWSRGSLSAQMSVTGGDLLVLAAYWAGAQQAVVTDTLGNAWNHLPASALASCGSNSDVAQLWYAQGAMGGDDTVTIMTSAYAALGMIVLEYAGAAREGAVDGQSTGVAVGPSNAMSVGSFATTSPTDVIVAVFQDGQGHGTMAPGSGYTARARDTDYFAMVEDNLPGPGSGNPTPTASLPAMQSDSCWTGAAAAFKAR